MPLMFFTGSVCFASLKRITNMEPELSCLEMHQRAPDAAVFSILSVCFLLVLWHKKLDLSITIFQIYVLDP